MCQTTQKSYDIKKSRIELFNKMREWCLDRWHDCYWIIPYDWRLGQIWYKFSCRFWHKYSTVKPRTLGHTWVDRDNLLAHTSFEILSDFVENEYPNSHDFEQLELIYGHLDSYDSYGVGGEPEPEPDVCNAPPGRGCNKAEVEGNSGWGISLGRRGQSETFLRIDRDGTRHLTHVTWAVGY